MDLMQELENLKQMVIDVEDQMKQAVEKEKKVAIGRARKLFQEIKKKSQEIRVALMDLRKK